MSDEKISTSAATDNTENSNTKDRRDFLRNSMLAAGAVATLVAAEGANAQTCYDAYGNVIKATTPAKVIDVALNSADVTLDDMYSILKQLGGLTGCLACGFNGFDLRFRINPVVKLSTRIPVAATIMG